jgi:hypothetical protein
MNGVLLWTTGIALSLALHAGVLIAVPRAFAPEPVADQPMPRSEMRVQTEAVAQSESTAIPPPADVMAAGDTQGANLSQNVIPQSRATAAPVAADRLAPAPPPDTTMAAAPPPASTLTAAPPPATTVASAPPAATTVASAPPPSAVVTATAVPRTQAIAAAPPPPVALITDSAATTPVLAAAPPPAQPLATVAGTAPTLAPAAPTAQPVTPAATGDVTAALPESAPATETITAELAFSGDGGVPLDPQALATIASFMQPGDPNSAASQARDALEALLSQVPCSRLQAEFDPDTGTIALRGHIPEEDLRAPVLTALQAQVGQGITVTDSMLILPRPQCGALSGIGAVGLPQSTDQTTNTRIVGNDAHARVFDYRGGDRLRLEMQAPDYDAYVYVDYYDAAGNVVHLIPNDIVPLTLHPAGSAMVVGESADGQPALEITVSPPFGQEIAVAFAASTPLYDGLRPTVEEAGPYLEWLAARVAEARAADPAFKGEWVYFFVATRAE